MDRFELTKYLRRESDRIGCLLRGETPQIQDTIRQDDFEQIGVEQHTFEEDTVEPDAREYRSTRVEQSSPLLDLPAELRLQIYKEVVTHDSPIQLALKEACKITDQRAVKNETACQPALSLTCRSARSDCLDMFYERNDFLGNDFLWNSERVTAAWLKAIGLRYCMMLRSLYLTTGSWQHLGPPTIFYRDHDVMYMGPELRYVATSNLSRSKCGYSVTFERGRMLEEEETRLKSIRSLWLDA